jgi:hypothetical protein
VKNGRAPCSEPVTLTGDGSLGALCTENLDLDIVVMKSAYVRSQNPTQMCFAPDDDVKETLAPDQSDQPFGNAILPKRELVR